MSCCTEFTTRNEKAAFTISETNIDIGLTLPLVDTIKLHEGINKDETISGFVEWDGAAPYFTVLGSVVTVELGGSGYINGAKVKWVGGQTVTLSDGKNYLGITAAGVAVLCATHTDMHMTHVNIAYIYKDINDVIIGASEEHGIDIPAASVIHNTFSIGTSISGPGGIIQKGAGKLEVDITGGNAYLLDSALLTQINNGATITMQQWFYGASGPEWITTSTDVSTQYYDGTLQLPPLRKLSINAIWMAKGFNDSPPSVICAVGSEFFNTEGEVQEAVAAGNVFRPHNFFPGGEMAQLGFVVVKNLTTGPEIVDVIVEKSSLGNSVFATIPHPPPAYWNTLVVDANGGGQYLSIDEALADAVEAGGFIDPTTILIYPGTHVVNNNIPANTILTGVDRENSILTGNIYTGESIYVNNLTMDFLFSPSSPIEPWSAGSSINISNCNIIASINSGNLFYASAGSFSITDCKIDASATNGHLVRMGDSSGATTQTLLFQNNTVVWNFSDSADGSLFRISGTSMGGLPGMRVIGNSFNILYGAVAVSAFGCRVLYLGSQFNGAIEIKDNTFNEGWANGNVSLPGLSTAATYYLGARNDGSIEITGNSYTTYENMREREYDILTISGGTGALRMVGDIYSNGAKQNLTPTTLGTVSIYADIRTTDAKITYDNSTSTSVNYSGISQHILDTNAIIGFGGRDESGVMENISPGGDVYGGVIEHDSVNGDMTVHQAQSAVDASALTTTFRISRDGHLFATTLRDLVGVTTGFSQLYYNSATGEIAFTSI